MNSIVKFLGEAAFARDMAEHPKQVGYAFRNSVNETVRGVQQYARDHFADDFTERNSFSRRGIVFDQARSSVIDNVEAVVGAAKNRPWLKKQEEGFTSSGAQATEAVRVAGSYKRAVRRKNYIQSAAIRRRMDVRNKAKTIRGKAHAMLAISYREGYGMKGSNDFFRFGKGEMFSSMEAGLYQFESAKTIGPLGHPKIIMAYRLDNRRTVKATPWLMEAIKQQGQPVQIVRRFETHLKKQIKMFR